MRIYVLLPAILGLLNLNLSAQERPTDPAELVRKDLVSRGVALEDLRELRIAVA
jgi:hypothetical protein